MLENRRHFRLREFIDVTWRLEGQEASGEGTVVNISASGLLLQTDRLFRPTDNCILCIESGTEALPFSAKKGTLVWFRHIHTPHERLQCGVEFLGGNKDNDLQQWLAQKVSRLSEAGDATILGNMVN